MHYIPDCPTLIVKDVSDCGEQDGFMTEDMASTNKNSRSAAICV